MEDRVGEVELGHAPKDSPCPVSAAPAAPSGKPTVTPSRIDDDGFTMVTRRKKMGPIKIQSKKNKSVRIKPPSQQDNPARTKGNQGANGLGGKQKTAVTAGSGPVLAPAGSKPKSVASSFNYARAVQGRKGSVNQHQDPPPMAANCDLSGPANLPLVPKDQGTNSVSHCSSMDIDISNHFSVLDIPNSIKRNKLVEAHDDLYPPDHGLVDGMDVETVRSKSKSTEFCQMNREHVNGSRILPESILSPLKPGVSSPFSLNGTGCSGKSYNITDAQKECIANCLKNVGSVSVDIVDQWCPGQWDYFNDLCTLMGLDPDYCIEDVDSDSENGTSLFLSGLLKSGNRNPPN
ncbi:hypothetical protein L1987_84576 [Smallanthus sonchifolius]|uniref:Uncharacterized protein n=1 Tax=Smallanthus sonchifolius TaxID=185202 RepID=A0ACB8XUN8_9ASTR|nr:hypothetical protein L1987_84576 [Smallanthus sonchifolius]